MLAEDFLEDVQFRRRIRLKEAVWLIVKLFVPKALLLPFKRAESMCMPLSKNDMIVKRNTTIISGSVSGR